MGFYTGLLDLQLRATISFTIGEFVVYDNMNGGENMPDGFSSYEGSAVRWTVHHDQGTTFVYATSESIALMRFMEKYPSRKVRKIVRG